MEDWNHILLFIRINHIKQHIGEQEENGDAERYLNKKKDMLSIGNCRGDDES
jgi:hypothetical protein